MSDVNVVNMQDGIDDVAPDFGSEPLPRGKYPVRVVSVNPPRKVYASGSSSCSITLEVIEGPLEGRKGVVTGFWLTPATTTSRDANGEIMRDNDGKVLSVKRSEDVVRKASRGIQGRVNGLFSACEVDRGDASHLDPTNMDSLTYVEHLFNAWGFESLIGGEFLATVRVDGDYNSLSNTYPLAHPQNGIEAWRRSELPGQLQRHGVQVSM